MIHPRAQKSELPHYSKSATHNANSTGCGTRTSCCSHCALKAPVTHTARFPQMSWWAPLHLWSRMSGGNCRACGVRTSGIKKLARPEVGNLYPKGVVQENILGLQVPGKRTKIERFLPLFRSAERRQTHLWMTPLECIYPNASTIWAA